jgi:peptidoglycan/xylan/chitin deacetylase (PgdA/CDA1 family)
MKGAFILSLDTEIAWGTFTWGGTEYYRRHFDGYRANVHRFIQLMDKYSIPATWAFVGHLMLEECDGTHPEAPVPDFPWYGKPWYAVDPGGDAISNPWWYAPDVLDRVLAMKTPQEIGTHTFSHVFLNDPAVTPEIAHAQIKASIDVARARGLTIESLVFPRDGVAHLDQYAELGITNYRGEERLGYQSLARPLRRAAGLCDHIAGRTPPVYGWDGLETQHGLLNIPGSTFGLAYDRYHRLVPTPARLAKFRRGLDAAADRDAIFHLAFHPFHLGSSEKMFDLFEQYFRLAATARDAGRIDILTMRDVQRAHSVMSTPTAKAA